MPEYTKGKWTLNVSEFRHLIIMDKDKKKIIATIGVSQVNLKQQKEQEANAQLIKMAPILLNALKESRKYFAAGSIDSTYVDAVIAKAEGNNDEPK